MNHPELIKSYGKFREYLREFYINGQKSRSELSIKSLSSYDNEKNRAENILKGYTSSYTVGKRVISYVSVDTRAVAHNPLYVTWKTRITLDSKIIFHFAILSILSEHKVLSQRELQAKISEIFEGIKGLNDESSFKGYLNEYVDLGILEKKKEKNKWLYSLSEGLGIEYLGKDYLDFFSEVAPCGVVGSYLLDRFDENKESSDSIIFKHHYITGAIDSEIMFELLKAIRGKFDATIQLYDDERTKKEIVPLKISCSVQNGRQYILYYDSIEQQISICRLDKIRKITINKPSDKFEECRRRLEDLIPHIWGASIPVDELEHVEFTISHGDNEEYIVKRLEREKRNGTVTRVGKNTSKFSIDVYDSNELIPWIRTFIGGITDIRFSNKQVENNFKRDLKKLYEIYNAAGDDISHDE